MLQDIADEREDYSDSILQADVNFSSCLIRDELIKSNCLFPDYL